MTTAPAARSSNDALRRAAQAVGAVFLLVGILGFIPGITQNYEAMQFAGPDSEAELLGVFQVSILHNIVHLLFGVGILMGRTDSGARAYLVGGGIIYLILWVYGLIVADNEGPANFVPVDEADNWLHLFLGIAMVGLGLLLSRRTDTTTGRATV